MSASCNASPRRSHRTISAAFTLALTLSPVLYTSTVAAEPVVKGTIAEGKVSWYGKKFTGRKTASGERFDHNAMTMAHPTWPFGTKVRVTNPANDKSIVLRINDRGPSIPDRIADVSSGAAQKLEIIRVGVAPLRLEVIELAPKKKSR